MAKLLQDSGYLMGPKIGSGSYSKVRLVERRSDGKPLAAKIINKKQAEKDYVQTFLPRELDIMSKVRHKHIACVEEVIHLDQWVFIIMEYAARGDLLDLIESKGAMGEREAKRVFGQIVLAVDHLHSNGIVHRDIKAENILIKEDWNIVVCDFGFSRKLEKNVLCKTFCGSSAYASPQIIRGVLYDAKANDVWGLGCVLFIMLFASMPFDDSNLAKMARSQSRGVTLPTKEASKLSESCKSLLHRLLEPDQKRRLTTHDILQCEWLKEEPKGTDNRRVHLLKS